MQIARNKIQSHYHFKCDKKLGIVNNQFILFLLLKKDKGDNVNMRGTQHGHRLYIGDIGDVADMGDIGILVQKIKGHEGHWGAWRDTRGMRRYSGDMGNMGRHRVTSEHKGEHREHG